jgi:oligopeptidase B
VVRAPIGDPSEKNWTPFIDHKPGLRIGGLTFFTNHLVVSEREGGLSYLRVVDMKTQQSHRIATDEPDYALSLDSNPEFNTTVVRFNYQSMVTPSSVYDYDLNSRERTLLKRQDVLGGYMPANYETASRCRSPSSTVRGRSSTALRRCCCMRTDRTACRSARLSRRRA